MPPNVRPLGINLYVATEQAKRDVTAFIGFYENALNNMQENITGVFEKTAERIQSVMGVSSMQGLFRQVQTIDQMLKNQTGRGISGSGGLRELSRGVQELNGAIRSLTGSLSD